jgi:hypothetical protein
VLSVTPPPESFSIQSPSSAEHVHLALNSIPLLNHANVNVILQGASIQPQSNVNVLEEEFGSTRNANALMSSHSGTVRIALHVHLEQTLNQKIANATTAQKDLLLIQSLTIVHQDFESSTDSCSFVFL